MKKRKKVVYAKVWMYLLLFPLACILKLWSLTLRLELSPQAKKIANKKRTPSIFLFWHNRLFCSAELYHRFRRKGKMCGLVSASKDGGYLAAFFTLMGIRSIRGSSNFRGTQAMREIIEALSEGYDFAITPDGPRGPRYKIKPGVLLLAEKTKAPLIFASWRYQSAWTLKSWDQFQIPLPFTKIYLNAVDFKDFDALKAKAKTKPLESYIEETLSGLASSS